MSIRLSLGRIKEARRGGIDLWFMFMEAFILNTSWSRSFLYSFSHAYSPIMRQSNRNRKSLFLMPPLQLRPVTTLRIQFSDGLCFQPAFALIFATLLSIDGQRPLKKEQDTQGKLFLGYILSLNSQCQDFTEQQQQSMRWELLLSMDQAQSYSLLFCLSWAFQLR